MAKRVPLLTRRHDLRRKRGDSAQHHREAAARPGCGVMMDAAELSAFTASVREAAQRHGTDFDKGLEEIGWLDALAEDPAAARAVFTVQGELNLSSSALDDVVLHALGRAPGPEAAVLFSPNRVGRRRLATASSVVFIHGHLAVTVPR